MNKRKNGEFPISLLLEPEASNPAAVAAAVVSAVVAPAAAATEAGEVMISCGSRIA